MAPPRPARATRSAQWVPPGPLIDETTRSSPDSVAPRMISIAHGLSSAVKTRSALARSTGARRRTGR
ncbi:hypothetical protein [Nocardioides sp. TF02-7]|uniref:hypothetical protein n=1 Tax=Nocardioides sp. TF02-7 TaxID=2917724 RepID=UPI001F06CA48|nr:hypothetical protein [Nocardioides sp. TF02-7]UMG94996.1 hypothetical protein MF408_02190 [Nocardioides sp. TF02-7]